MDKKMMEHELMRWGTMSKVALERRLYKIRGKDKLECFLTVASARDNRLYLAAFNQYKALFGSAPKVVESEFIGASEKYRIQNPEVAAVKRSIARDKAQAEFRRVEAMRRLEEENRLPKMKCRSCGRFYNPKRWTDCPFCSKWAQEQAEKLKVKPKVNNNDRYLDF